MPGELGGGGRRKQQHVKLANALTSSTTRRFNFCLADIFFGLLLYFFVAVVNVPVLTFFLNISDRALFPESFDRWQIIFTQPGQGLILPNYSECCKN